MPAASSWRSRFDRSVRDSPGSPRARSLKRVNPHSMSRTIRTDHRSPSTSTARAIGQYWPYPLVSVMPPRLPFHADLLSPESLRGGDGGVVLDVYRFGPASALGRSPAVPYVLSSRPGASRPATDGRRTTMSTNRTTNPTTNRRTSRTGRMGRMGRPTGAAGSTPTRVGRMTTPAPAAAPVAATPVGLSGAGPGATSGWPPAPGGHGPGGGPGGRAGPGRRARPAARCWASGPTLTTRPTSPRLMADHRRRGDRVVVVTATLGEHGTSDPAAWPPAAWRHAAGLSCRPACRVGVDELHLLGYEDGTCDRQDDAVATARIARAWPRCAPTCRHVRARRGHRPPRPPSRSAAGPPTPWARTVPPPSCGTRPSRPEFHRDLGRAERADRPVGRPARAAVDGPGRPRLGRRAARRAWRSKLAALEAHRSQTGAVIELVGRAIYREWWRTESFRRADVVALFARSAAVPAAAGIRQAA